MARVADAVREKHAEQSISPLPVKQERLRGKMTSKLRPKVREELISEERYIRC